jgi:hypothetical protein
MGVNRDGRARGQARAMNGTVGNRLGKRQKFDARKEVDL